MIKNIVMSLICLYIGYSIIDEPKWISAHCGGCEVDLTPFHWPIGLFFIAIALYIIWLSYQGRKNEM